MHEPLYFFSPLNRSLKRIIKHAEKQKCRGSVPEKHLSAYFLTANIDNALNELEKSIKKTTPEKITNESTTRVVLSSTPLYPKWNDWVVNIENKVIDLELATQKPRMMTQAFILAIVSSMIIAQTHSWSL